MKGVIKTDNFPVKEELSEDDFIMQSESGTDCTGLMPTPPLTEAEEESYDEVYDFLPTAVKKQPREQ